MKILLLKLKTDGEDMCVSLDSRLQRWEEACVAARTKRCSIVAAPEYFFVSPAIKTQEAVQKVLDSRGGMEVPNRPGTSTFIAPDVCDILGLGTGDERTMDRIENGQSSEGYTYYTSSRSLPRNEWTGQVKTAFQEQSNHPINAHCVYFGGTSVYSKRLAEKKQRTALKTNGSIRPWEAQLASLSYSKSMQNQQSMEERMEWDQLEGSPHPAELHVRTWRQAVGS